MEQPVEKVVGGSCYEQMFSDSELETLMTKFRCEGGLVQAKRCELGHHVVPFWDGSKYLEVHLPGVGEMEYGMQIKHRAVLTRDRLIKKIIQMRIICQTKEDDLDERPETAWAYSRNRLPTTCIEVDVEWECEHLHDDGTITCGVWIVKRVSTSLLLLWLGAADCRQLMCSRCLQFRWLELELRVWQVQNCWRLFQPVR